MRFTFAAGTSPLAVSIAALLIGQSLAFQRMAPRSTYVRNWKCRSVSTLSDSRSNTRDYLRYVGRRVNSDKINIEHVIANSTMLFDSVSDDRDNATIDLDRDNHSTEASTDPTSQARRSANSDPIHWSRSKTPIAATAIALAATAIPRLPAHAVGLSAYTTSLVDTGFYQAFTLVFLSELGDKTFFIAGLLAMKTSRLISFVGSIGALAAMTVISVVIGQVFHNVPSGLLGDGVKIPLDDVAAVLAFTFFGVKILKEALDMDSNESGTPSASSMDEELEEAEEVVQENSAALFSRNSLGQIASIFGLVFAAELGDRSFLSTIALSAAQNPIAVGFGAIAAHTVATGVAVAGGSVVAKYLSEKVIGLIGGTLFLVFAFTTAIGIF